VALGVIGVAQLEQNLAAGGKAVPHWRHSQISRVPQWTQNSLRLEFSVLQFGHCIVASCATLHCCKPARLRRHPEKECRLAIRSFEV
jgi:hypothetical protein